MPSFSTLISRFNQWPVWRHEVKVWDRRLAAVSFDRLLNLYLHRLGLMNADLRTFFTREIRPGMTVVDIGANQGLFTLLFSGLVGGAGRVLAFEPDPELYGVLEYNCRANAAVNVTLHPAALGSRPGSMVLHRSLWNAGDNRFTPGLPLGSFRLEQVAVSTLDEIAGPAAVDFIKMDVQGWEGEVVEGMTRVLANNPRIRVCFEFWPCGLTRAGCDPPALLDAFRQRGFALHELRAGRSIPVTDDGAFCRRLSGTRYTDLLAARPDSL